MAQAADSPAEHTWLARLDLESLQEFVTHATGLPPCALERRPPPQRAFLGILERSLSRARTLGRTGQADIAGPPFPFNLRGLASFSSRGVERRRYWIRYDCNWLGSDPADTLQGLLETVGPPDQVLAWLHTLRRSGELSAAVDLGMEWDRSGRMSASLVFLQPPLSRLLCLDGFTPGSSPSGVGLEWRLDGAGSAVLQRARVIETPRGPQLTEICKGFVTDGEGEPLARALQNLATRQETVQWETWSDVADRFQEGSSKQEALRVTLTPAPLWEQRKPLKDLIATACNASNSFLEFAREQRGTWLRAVHLGRRRDGLAMVVLEHQPPGMTPAAMKQALADEIAAVATRPGALVLELTTAASSTSTRIAVIHEEHAGALPVQPCGRAGPVRVYAGSEIARTPKLSQALAEVVQNTADGVREATDKDGELERLEWEIAATLLEHGWKLERWTINPT